MTDAANHPRATDVVETGVSSIDTDAEVGSSADSTSLADVERLILLGKVVKRKYSIEYTDETLLRQRKGKREQVVRDLSLCTGIGRRLPTGDETLAALFTRIDAEIRLECNYEDRRKSEKDSIDGGIKNVHGAWFEWLLAAIAWNVHVELKTEHVAVQLQNKPFNVNSLYAPRLSELIEDLRSKLEAYGVRLESSNPDFVIVKASLIRRLLPKIETLDEPMLQQLDALYTDLIGRCDYADIVGYIGAKFTLRADRRLQMPSEGSLMKALYSHLKTRLWESEAPGITYFAASTHANERDRQVMETVATASIVIPNSEPERAVDWLYIVPTVHAVRNMFVSIYDLTAKSGVERANALKAMTLAHQGDLERLKADQLQARASARDANRAGAEKSNS